MPDDAGAVRLIVNADDFGSSAAVNAGVAEAHANGVVTSATLMAGGAAFADALARLDDLPALGVGVHLTLVDGPPVLDHARAPTLIDEAGRLPAGAGAFARRYLTGNISLADVKAELAAQLGRVRDAGVRITHVDSHQHLHNFPGVAGVVVALAREFGVRACRSSRVALSPVRRGWLGRQLILRLCAEAFGAKAERAGLKLPDGLLGQEWAGALNVERMVKMVEVLKGGTWELLCHPATAPDEGAPSGYDRPGELAVLTAPEIRAALEDRGVRLVNFAAL